MFAIVDASFTFDLGGKVVSEFAVNVLDLELDPFETGLTSDWLLVGIEALLVVWLITLAVTEASDMVQTIRVDGWRGYFLNFWNVTDVASLSLYIVCCAVYFGVWSKSSTLEIPRVYDWSPVKEQQALLKTIKTVEECDELMTQYVQLSVVNLCVVLLRLFKFMRLQPHLAVVNNTFIDAGLPLFHFFVIFGIVLIMFTIMVSLACPALRSCEQVYSRGAGEGVL